MGMNMTPEQRRERIYEMAKSDSECCKMYEEFAQAKARFTKLTDLLPKRTRNLLWSYPGMGYFLHHRILTLICLHMKFSDEE